MEAPLNAGNVFDTLLELYKNYCLVHRRTISYDKYHVLSELGLPEPAKIGTGESIVAESLLEHVGTLPVVATFLYPYLEHKEKINLGRVLMMLAIHDIGETVVGDEHPHKKTQKHIESEHQAALSLLSEEYHALLNEYEARESFEAKYVKAVDVLSTFLADQLYPPLFTQERLKNAGFSWQEIDERRYKVFEWDSFLKELFLEVAKRYKSIESS